MSDPTRALLASALDLSSPEKAWLAAQLLRTVYPEAIALFAAYLPEVYCRRVCEATGDRIDAVEHAGT